MRLANACSFLASIQGFWALLGLREGAYGYLEDWRKFEGATSGTCQPSMSAGNTVAHVHEGSKDEEVVIYDIKNTRDCLMAFYEYRITRPTPKFCRALAWQNLTKWSRNDMKVNTENMECLSHLRNISPRVAKSNQRMCTYLVERDDSRSGGDADAFVIKEDICDGAVSGVSNDDRQTRELSMFDVLTKEDVVCETKYNASASKYQVNCPRPTGGSSSSCLYAWLDYESGDAFNDVSGFLRPLRAPLQSKTPGLLCVDFTKNGYDTYSADAVASRRRDLVIGKNEKEQAALRACLATQEMYFIGDSHLRYLFDAALLAYSSTESEHAAIIKKLRSLPHHHGHARYGNTTYYPFHFSYQLARALLGDFCEARTEKDSNDGRAGGGGDVKSTNNRPPVTVVINPGSWDLDYMPLREVLSPGMAPALIEAIRSMASGEANCTRPINLVVLTPLPYPRRGKESIIRGYNNPQQQSESGYRNEYSVGAMNDYWLRELTSISLYLHNTSTRHASTMSLMVVDGFSVVPHTVNGRMERVCGFHYLCPKRERGSVTIESTEAGNHLFNTLIDTALLCPES